MAPLDRSLVWLVTGCSSGLGRHLALAILQRGDSIIATARRTSDLAYLDQVEGASGRVCKITLDVTDTAENIQKSLETGIERFGRVDVLVNNAGFVVSGVWEELSDQDVRKQFDTNFFGSVKVTQCILPYMRKTGSGVILFMGSISGWLGVGAGGPYSASKFAIEGAAECLSKETSHLGIRTHILVLGQFRTNILDDSRKGGMLESSQSSAYEAIKAEMADRHKATHGRQPGDPEAAAQRIVDLARLENLSADERDNLGLRIPMGTDALETIRLKCKETLASLDPWEAFASSTDYAGAESVPSYAR